MFRNGREAFRVHSIESLLYQTSDSASICAVGHALSSKNDALAHAEETSRYIRVKFSKLKAESCLFKYLSSSFIFV